MFCPNSASKPAAVKITRAQEKTDLAGHVRDERGIGGKFSGVVAPKFHEGGDPRQFRRAHSRP
jgi:hypothetical protein